VQLPGSVLPGRDRPLPAPTPESDFDFRIESPRRSPVPRAVDELRFPLRDIRITGATVVPPDELRTLYENLIGQEVGLSDVVGIAEEIEAKYRERGYILTRAFVPPQRVGDGIFQINVVEGFIKEVSVEGGPPEIRKLIEAYLRPVLNSRPLRTEVMERALLLANDLPGVTASGVLRPAADEPGASDLVVSVAQKAYSAALSIDNRSSPFTGPWTVTGDGAYNAMDYGPHQLVGSINFTPGSLERVVPQLRYIRPIGEDGLTVSFGGTGSYGTPGGALTDLQLVTNSYAIGPRVSYPLMRTRANSIIFDGGLTIQDARVRTRLPAFQDKEAPVDSHDIWRVADISATYINNGFLSGISSATLGVAQGLAVFGASRPSASDPSRTDEARSRADGSPDFTKVTMALRRTQLIEGPWTAFGSMIGQYSTKGLFAGEEIAFGGNQIGRGYDPGAITGDAGVGGSAELRYDEKFEEYYVENAQFYVFYDVATVTNRSPSQLTHSINSTGFGVRLSLPDDIAVNLEFAHTLEGVPTSDNGRIGSKLYFGAAMRF
jgi:hemolysin activation/secretion protein